MNEQNENDKLSVLLLKPGEQAEIAEIEDNLESMQRLVEGNIEEYMPFEDASDPRIGDCAIVCNEEGKMLGMELNRGIFDRNILLNALSDLRTKQIREGLPTDPDDRKHTANNSVFPGDLLCQYRQLALNPAELPE